MQRRVNFLTRDRVAERFRGKTVAIVGSGPGVMTNRPKFVDSHDVVVRVNNYKLFRQTGFRTDVYYSYFGNAIKKKPAELRKDGVTLCMCKCPNDRPIESDWHEKTGRTHGIDFRWIYEARQDWWFCDTYIPESEVFMQHFRMLGGHVPTTGFSAILDILSFDPKLVYITGFDFFKSGVHNVNERWKRGNMNDPIGHVPEKEFAWLKQNARKLPIMTDSGLNL